jgi:hypothetical protein
MLWIYKTKGHEWQHGQADSEGWERAFVAGPLERHGMVGPRDGKPSRSCPSAIAASGVRIDFAAIDNSTYGVMKSVWFLPGSMLGSKKPASAGRFDKQLL